MSMSPAADGEQDGFGAQGTARPRTDADLLREYDIQRLQAPNASAMTLSGTNTWVVGRGPAWVVDPGPSLEAHLEQLFAAVAHRGGLGGIVLTHEHHDHAEAVPALLERHPAPVAAGRGQVDRLLKDGVSVGPFEAVATPGHSPDHFALITGGACFTGDAVLGEGSVFVSPYPGSMAGYLRGLSALRERVDLTVLCPGHGPLVWDVQAKLEEYVEHRIDRENDVIMALGEGRRSVQELLDAVWSDVPRELRGPATVTLAAHLDKLDEERVLPRDVERPVLERMQW
jgi:glyoxylase-like metal-dependent hydrolase (beta-lactamase superfamily II)